MRGAWILFRRELAGLFLSPLAWVLLLVSLLVNGAFFYLYLSATEGDVTYSLQLASGLGTSFWALLVVLPPLLAMRLVSEESRTGTLEYLLTAPVSDTSVVAGKFLAATTFMALLLLSVPLYGAGIHLLGVRPDWGALVGGYVGSVLAAALFVAIGMLASTATSTPLLAAFLGFVACSVWLTLPLLANLITSQLGSLLAPWPEAVELLETYSRTVFEQMNVAGHLQRSFMRGVFDTSELVFFGSWVLFFLFLTVRVLEMRRWRG